MALQADLSNVQRACTKALNLIALAGTTTTVLDPTRDLDGETQITLTPAQRQQLQNTLTNLVTFIKTTAAGMTVP